MPLRPWVYPVLGTVLIAASARPPIWISPWRRRLAVIAGLTALGDTSRLPIFYLVWTGLDQDQIEGAGAIFRRGAAARRRDVRGLAEGRTVAAGARRSSVPWQRLGRGATLDAVLRRTGAGAAADLMVSPDRAYRLNWHRTNDTKPRLARQGFVERLSERRVSARLPVVASRLF